jgi:intracellular septation protein A
MILSDRLHADHHDQLHDHLIEIGRVGKVVGNALLMLTESVLIPTLILFVAMRTVGAATGLIGVIAWCMVSMGARWVRGKRVPSTMLLVIGILVLRTGVALAFSSVWIFLLQPVAASVLMALLFIGSAVIGRPVTQRLAQDFVHLPERLLTDRRVRRMFVEVAVIWGLSRVMDAAMSLGSLHYGAEFGVLARGILSIGFTALSIGACTYWGWRRMHAIPGVRLRFAAPTIAA